MVKLLFRASLAEENELQVAREFFSILENRAEVCPGDEVLCRYSSLPYHNELEKDIRLLGGELVNTYENHKYVADISNWYYDLERYTPKTWFSLEQFTQNAPENRYVVKGETNSKKQRWQTHMFAENKEQAKNIYFRLMDDGLIGSQNIVFRHFEDFISYGQGINGAPITKEFRVFVLDGCVVGSGYYWSIFPEVVEKYKPVMDKEAEMLIEKVISVVSPNIRFFVVDIAQRNDWTWRVVELNDGCMSGLSCISAETLYSNIKGILNA